MPPFNFELEFCTCGELRGEGKVDFQSCHVQAKFMCGSAGIYLPGIVSPQPFLDHDDSYYRTVTSIC